MSNLLSQASLVMIPSGYKEDIVYSPVPTNGNGDLTFTRASNGTRVNSAGLVEVVPWNLLQYSNAFNTAPWSMNVTSGQAGKDGQNNAWLLTKLGATTSDYYNSNVYNGDQTFTIYVKKESGKGFKLYPIGTTTTNVEINLQTGVVFNQGAGITSTTVEAYSSTWWKISVALNMVNSNYYIYVTDGAGTQIAGSITIQDAQVNIGLTAKPYFPTTDRLNVPRLTYQNGGGGCPSLLLEKQSTNLVLHSEQFDATASWSYSECSVTANQTISPDGTQNADKLVENSANTIHEIYQGLTLTGGTAYTNTIYAKSAERTQIAINFVSGGFGQGSQVIANLSTGTLGTITNYGGVTGSTATITNVGNDWYRISLTMTPVSTTTFYADYSPAVNGNPFYQGNGTSGIYIWGAQIEASSYATSYIPTTSSSATRVADACYKTGISSLFGTNQGTFVIDFVYYGSEQFSYLFDVTDSANLNRFLMYDSNGSGLYYFYDSGYSQITTYQFTKGQRYKIAVKYNSSGTIWYVNGVLSATGTVSFAHQMSQLYLGIRYSLSDNTGMQVNETIVFPTALSNTELQAITTI